MKIQVVRCDGHTEILTLVGTVTITEPYEDAGILMGRGCLHLGTGVDHFFRVDGRYDGWGMGLGDGGVAEEVATALIEAVEQDREVARPSDLDA